MSRTGFIFALIFVAVLTAIAAFKAHGAVGPLLIDAPIHNAAAPICVPPMSHYQWKQRRIA